MSSEECLRAGGLVNVLCIRMYVLHYLVPANLFYIQIVGCCCQPLRFKSYHLPPSSTIIPKRCESMFSDNWTLEAK